MAVAAGSIKGRHDSYRIGEHPVFRPAGSSELFAVEDNPELLYKRFYEPLGQGHAGRIAELVEVGREIKTRRKVARDVRRIAWPVDLVLKRGQVAGVLIPRAGDGYFCPVARPIPQDFSHLAAVGAPPLKQRLLIVRQLASALVLLGQHELIHGDISATNQLWTINPTPSMLLIDCDTLHLPDFAMPAYFTKYWTDPRLEAGLIPSHDAESDWYALALAVYRVIVLNSRATPRTSDGDRLRAQLPPAIGELLAPTFTNPLEPGARGRPGDWGLALAGVIEDEGDCRKLEAITRDLPTTVAGRRGLRESSPGVRRKPRKPDVSSSSSELAGAHTPAGSASAATPTWYKASGSRRHWLRKLLVSVVGMYAAVFALYYFTGLPNWRILNTLDLLLSEPQRSLVAALPAGVKHCRGEPTVLANGALATVRCEWSGHELLAIKFANLTSMNAYYHQRKAIGDRLMAGHGTLSQCPHSTVWRMDANPNALGYATTFISTLGARLDWTSTATLTYRIGLGSAGDLAALCTWWAGLTER
jgi:hypothetical protein